MQNSPLLVTKTSPVNNTNSPLNQEPSKQPSESFENVLSKSVKHQEAHAPDAKDVNVRTQGSSLKEDVKQNKADAPVSVAVDELLDINEGLLPQLNAELAVDGDVLAADVDAQTLAAEATSKALLDVTEGKVVIDVKPEASVLIRPEVSTLQVPLSNMMAAIQAATKPTTADSRAVVDTDGLEALQSPVAEAGKETVSDKKTERNDGRLQANAAQDEPLKASNEKLNPKITNMIASESKQQASAETLIDTNIKASTDAATMSLQMGGVKPASALSQASLATSPLQAGASNVINAAPGKAGWNEAVSQKVVWMVGATEQSATLTLNPKDLGPLQVIIHVNNEKADATFITENPEVRKALEEGMSTLRNAMGQSGVELGQANVNTSKQHQDFQQASKEYAARQQGGVNSEQEADQIPNQPVRTHVSNGLVDTFV